MYAVAKVASMALVGGQKPDGFFDILNTCSARPYFVPAEIVCWCGNKQPLSRLPIAQPKDVLLADAQSKIIPWRNTHMQKLALIACTLAILSIPALAGPATSDKPIVVAEESGVSVRVGDRDHDRDRDHKVVVIKHHDRDDDHHHKVVEIKHHDRDDYHHRKVVEIKHHDREDDHGHDFH